MHDGNLTGLLVHGMLAFDFMREGNKDNELNYRKRFIILEEAVPYFPLKQIIGYSVLNSYSTSAHKGFGERPDETCTFHTPEAHWEKLGRGESQRDLRTIERITGFSVSDCERVIRVASHSGLLVWPISSSLDNIFGNLFKRQYSKARLVMPI